MLCVTYRGGGEAEGLSCHEEGVVGNNGVDSLSIDSRRNALNEKGVDASSKSNRVGVFSNVLYMWVCGRVPEDVVCPRGG